MFLFLILINFAGLNHDDLEEATLSEDNKAKQKSKVLKKTHQKYVDDHTFEKDINLNAKLKPFAPEDIFHPINLTTDLATLFFLKTTP